MVHSMDVLSELKNVGITKTIQVFSLSLLWQHHTREVKFVLECLHYYVAMTFKLRFHLQNLHEYKDSSFRSNFNSWKTFKMDSHSLSSGSH